MISLVIAANGPRSYPQGGKEKGREKIGWAENLACRPGHGPLSLERDKALTRKSQSITAATSPNPRANLSE
jgi:hypothetical protein